MGLRKAHRWGGRSPSLAQETDRLGRTAYCLTKCPQATEAVTFFCSFFCCPLFNYSGGICAPCNARAGRISGIETSRRSWLTLLCNSTRVTQAEKGPGQIRSRTRTGAWQISPKKSFFLRVIFTARTTLSLQGQDIDEGYSTGRATPRRPLHIG